MTSRATPHLLAPYLALAAPGSLTLLTNVLSATSNWLVVRYLQSLLPAAARGKASSAGGGAGQDGEGEADGWAGVVLVSFLRDFAFWGECAGKLGVDLSRHCKDGNFVFVDGLTSLFIPPVAAAATGLVSAKGRMTLTSAKLADIRRDIQAAIASVASEDKNVVLIIDQPDLLLAATEGSAIDMQNTVLSLREHVHSTIFAVSADMPLIAEQHTTMERMHAGFALDLAHQADTVVSLRMLDTGVAKDVSGVMRITRGGGGGGGHDAGGLGVDEHEYLYYIAADGGVRVFKRGQ
ncbi:hypothetical protein BROUX41_002350 [Berkeleyomyces rouxiae]|uniref:uncharacterized protein n=1 Tax=Berkeleyomyces rouxiae TaxID=2035830 RepID=UPI003B7FE061